MPQQHNISHPTDDCSELMDAFIDILATIAADDVLKPLNE